jgi:SAM-dependent methyltransferase
MDALYLLQDPWGMNSPSEQSRFAETNRLLLEKFGHVGSLLEVGCGEGHQSIYLRHICDTLTGLDICGRAVERARTRHPGGRYIVGDLFSPAIADLAHFDLVMACEVLYYINDLEAALRRMRELGRNGFVTYFDKMMEKLDPLVLSLPGVSSEILKIGDACWRAVWWSERSSRIVMPAAPKERRYLKPRSIDELV